MSALTEKGQEELRRFGWTLGPDFEKRYLTDTWVFNLANAVEAVAAERDVERARADAAEAEVERCRQGWEQADEEFERFLDAAAMKFPYWDDDLTPEVLLDYIEQLRGGYWHDAWQRVAEALRDTAGALDLIAALVASAAQKSRAATALHAGLPTDRVTDPWADFLEDGAARARAVLAGAHERV